MIRMATAALAAVIVLAAFGARDARADELSDIKKRMKARYPALLELRKVGKVGETYLGHVEARKAEFLDDKVKVGDETMTVRDLIAAETKDRKKAYELLAEKTGGTAEAIAKTNAKRNFEKAEPEEWLKTKDGWVQKKDLKDDDEGK